LAKARCKYGFLFITLLYLKVVKGGNNIKLGIDFSLAKPLKNFIYKRYAMEGKGASNRRPLITLQE